MKAIIVEIKGKHAAILSDDGVISKIRNKNYSLGQEITIKNNSMMSNKLIKMTAAAAAAIMIFVTPAWAYLTPYSYVSVDVNPSFEFYINRFDRVLTVKALNDDGKELSKDINIEGLKNKDIQSAVRNVLNELKNKGYIIEGEEGGVIVATSSKSKEKTDILFEKMQNAVNEDVRLEEEESKVTREPSKPESKKVKETEIRQENEETSDNKTENLDKENELKEQEKEIDKEQEKRKKEIDKEEEKSKKEIEKEEEKRQREEEREKQEKPNKSDRKKFNGKVIEVTEEEVDEAKKLGITPGKLNLIEKLQEAAIEAGYKDKIKTDEWIDKSVQEINSQIKEYREELNQEDNKINKDNKNNKDNKDNKDNKNNKNNKNGKSNDAKNRKEKNGD